jgi:hypothetical protein
MQLADPHRLYLITSSLRADAATLLRLQTVLLAEAAVLGWHSPAARAFQLALHSALAELRRFGSRLDELAGTASALLDRLSRVDHRLAELGAGLVHRSAPPALGHRAAR